MSLIARSRSFSKTMSAGISRATMRSKMLGSVDMFLAAKRRRGSPARRAARSARRAQRGPARASVRSTSRAEAHRARRAASANCASSFGEIPPSGPTTRVMRSCSSSTTSVRAPDAVGSRARTRPGSAARSAVVASAATSGTHARIACLLASRTIAAQRSRPLLRLRALPPRHRALGRPRDHAAHAQLGRGLDRQLVAVALREGLREPELAGAGVPRDGRARRSTESSPSSVEATAPSTISPAPSPTAMCSPTRNRATEIACRASSPVTRTTPPATAS